jgi:hypothetical protein
MGLGVYEEMSFKVKVYGRRTDGRRTKSDHKSSPCHFVTGELKTKEWSYGSLTLWQIRVVQVDVDSVIVWNKHF